MTARAKTKRVRPGAAVEISGGKALEFHDLCLAFPPMPPDEFEALKDDIKRAGGVREHGWLYEGKIIEGRHRYQAARALRLPMRFKTFTGNNPVAFVVSCNMRRRHLDESQRAMIAARLEGYRHGGKRGGNVIDFPILTRREAARIAGAGHRSVARAAVVRDKGAASLNAAVDRAEVPVAIAAVVAAAKSKAEQDALIALGAAGIMQAAKAIRADQQAKRHVERQVKLETIAAGNPEAPKGRKFSLVYIDIPRKHNVYSDATGSEKSPENHYPVMTFAETLDFAIDRFAAKDCVIAFWSTAASLIDDIEILADWGFIALRPRDKRGKIIRDKDGAPAAPVGGGKYGSLQIWRKVRVGKAMGMGRWFRDQHEQLIFARRGDVPAPLPGKQDHSVFDAPIGKHSAKPPAPRTMMSRLWRGLTKIEVFGRGKAPKGWVFWGNQAEAPAGIKVRPAVWSAGDRVSQRALDVLAAKCLAGEVEFRGEDDGRKSARIARLKSGAFTNYARLGVHFTGERKDIAEGVHISLTGKTAEITSYTDATGCGFSGSTMPYSKVEKFLRAWGKAKARTAPEAAPAEAPRQLHLVEAIEAAKRKRAA